MIIQKRNAIRPSRDLLYTDHDRCLSGVYIGGIIYGYFVPDGFDIHAPEAQRKRQEIVAMYQRGSSAYKKTPETRRDRSKTTSTTCVPDGPGYLDLYGYWW